MRDIDLLPEDLREAVEQFDCVTMHGDKWKIIRAALLRVYAAPPGHAVAMRAHEYRNDQRVVVRCEVPPSWNGRRVAITLLPEHNT